MATWVDGKQFEAEGDCIGFVACSLREHAGLMDSIAGWLAGLKSLNSRMHPTPPLRGSTS